MEKIKLIQYIDLSVQVKIFRRDENSFGHVGYSDNRDIQG
jgi:hypothetical protein